MDFKRVYGDQTVQIGAFAQLFWRGRCSSPETYLGLTRRSTGSPIRPAPGELYVGLIDYIGR